MAMLDKAKQLLIQTLRKFEPYAKTDMVAFFKGNFWLNTNRVMGVINGLILSVAFAHLLTKAEYGLYSYALAFIGIFSMPQTTGLGAGIQKGVTREDNSIVNEGLRRILPWSLVGSAGLLLSAAYYFFNENPTLAFIFLIAGIVLPLSIANGVSKSFLSLKADFASLTKFNIVRTPVLTIALVISAWLTHSALVVALTSIVGGVIMSTLLYVFMRKNYDFTPPIPEKREAFAGRYALHSAFLSIVSYLAEKVDSLLLWKFLGGEPLAIYVYASTPVRELRTIFENQGSLVLPKYAKREFKDVKASIAFRIKQMYFIAVPLIVLYVLAAPYIFSILFPQYVVAVPYSQLIALSILASPRRLMSAAIAAHQKIKESYVMVIAPNVTRIIAAVVFIPLYGIAGAVMAYLLSEVVDYIILGLLMIGSSKQPS
jgi:polysaccharide transporter, PST family